MVHELFANQVKEKLKPDPNVIGVGIVGSWLSNEIDEFSDLDLIIVTKEKVGGNKDEMLKYAAQLGNFLSGFTGEHVGEPRVLICLYDNPLLHVDLKFLTLEEFHQRIETPFLLLDKEDQLQNALHNSAENSPLPDFQWIEDRFWIWVHYALTKIGRGEYLEAYDFFGFLRMVVIGPLIHLKNNNLPRGVRKVETSLAAEDLKMILSTIPSYTKESLLLSLNNAVTSYKALRQLLFPKEIKLQTETEQKVMIYFNDLKL